MKIQTEGKEKTSRSRGGIKSYGRGTKAEAFGDSLVQRKKNSDVLENAGEAAEVREYFRSLSYCKRKEFIGAFH